MHAWELVAGRMGGKHASGQDPCTRSTCTSRRTESAARLASLVVLAVVLGQATLGVLNVWWQMPGIVTAAHSAGAAATVLATTWLVVQTWRAPLRGAATVADRSPTEPLAAEAS